MFSRALLALCSLLAASFPATNAVPVRSDIGKRDVWDPQLLEPHFGTVWKSGLQHNVTWDTSSQPAEITNNNGTLYLVQNGTTLINLGPLAQGFNLTSGRVEITVPDVIPGCDYQFLLMGDSGNVGPNFIIAADGD